MRALVAAAVVAVPLCALAPASTAYASNLPEQAISVSFPNPVQYTGGWSEGTVRLTNPTQSTHTGVHPYLRLSRLPQHPLASVEFSETPGGAWKPLTTTTDPETGDITGDLGPAAGVTVAPGYDHAWRVRVRLPQMPTEGPVNDVNVALVVATGVRPGGNFEGIVGVDGGELRVTGLNTSYTGLPKQVPADAKPHEFQVHIKTQNKADWHLGKSSFGLDLGRSMSGTSACDAQIEVKDQQGTWHKVKNGAEGMTSGDVDLANWATGPVDDRVVQARISVGGGYATPANHVLGFGYYPGAGPNNYYEKFEFTTVAVPGAAKCAGGETTPPTTAPTTPTDPSTAAPVPPAKGGGTELADTGSDNGNTMTLVGVASALVLVGAGTTVVLRRRRA
ncbi:LPXTG cell wall anchor domain-containing protein [Embleya scabrispora]|uniref:LPXTG cell wall anchor domain-containing protein n=1 Tax=Embleya scabrispora TaxID=159449 RepID=UPI001374D4B2|nr:LPXTG cell wall anchor domain-containing protein [Embleya scabrispora]